MNNSSKIPLVITKNSFSITLKGKTAEALLQQPRPILWNNDGMYCWISLIRIKNQVRCINDTITHAKANDQLYEPIFMLTWDGRTHHYSEEMAQAIELMSQQSNNNGSDSADPSDDKSNT